MSTESAKEFVKRMMEDQSFSEAMGKLDSREARIVFIRQQGYDFSLEEMTAEAVKLNAVNVAGGSCCGHTCEKDQCSKDSQCLYDILCRTDK